MSNPYTLWGATPAVERSVLRTYAYRVALGQAPPHLQWWFDNLGTEQKLLFKAILKEEVQKLKYLEAQRLLQELGK